MTKLGERIKQRRKELNMTQDELRKRLGLANNSSISVIESGKVDVSTEQLIQIADILNVSVVWLLGLEPEKVYLHDYDPLVRAYKHADKETQLVVRRILGVKKEELDSSIKQAN